MFRSARDIFVESLHSQHAVRESLSASERHRKTEITQVENNPDNISS